MGIRILVCFVAIIVICVVVLLILLVVNPDIFSKNKKIDGEIISSEDKESKIIQDDFQKSDTKDFLIFKELDDYSMDLGNHNYRGIVEVSSVNYLL